MCKKYIVLLLFLGIKILFFIKQCPLKLMFGNDWWSRKVGAKLPFDFVIFSILSCNVLLDFQ